MKAPQLTERAAPTRAVWNGLSLLLLVAMALQLPGVSASAMAEESSNRQVTPGVVDQVQRYFQKRTADRAREVPCSGCVCERALSGRGPELTLLRAPAQVPAARRLGLMLTSLPPPGER